MTDVHAHNEETETDDDTGRWIDDERRRGRSWNTISADLDVDVDTARALHLAYCELADAVAARLQLPLFDEPPAQLGLFPDPAP